MASLGFALRPWHLCFQYLQRSLRPIGSSCKPCVKCSPYPVPSGREPVPGAQCTCTHVWARAYHNPRLIADNPRCRALPCPAAPRRACGSLRFPCLSQPAAAPEALPAVPFPSLPVAMPWPWWRTGLTTPRPHTPGHTGMPAPAHRREARRRGVARCRPLCTVEPGRAWQSLWQSLQLARSEEQAVQAQRVPQHAGRRGRQAHLQNVSR